MASQPPANALPLFYKDLEPLSSSLHPNFKSRSSDIPSATYRLQIHAGFPLDDAAAVAGYLADLGVTHAYASPLLRSAEGSTHGYDTVDHAHIDEARGGREGFDRFVEALHEHGLGLVLDLVPNHTAAEHPWFEDSSAYPYAPNP